MERAAATHRPEALRARPLAEMVDLAGLSPVGAEEMWIYLNRD